MAHLKRYDVIFLEECFQRNDKVFAFLMTALMELPQCVVAIRQVSPKLTRFATQLTVPRSHVPRLAAPFNLVVILQPQLQVPAHHAQAVDTSVLVTTPSTTVLWVIVAIHMTNR